MTLKDIIKNLVLASGPISFASCLHYARDQHCDETEDWQVAVTLTALIRQGVVELYEDGESFCACTGPLPQKNIDPRQAFIEGQEE